MEISTHATKNWLQKEKNNNKSIEWLTTAVSTVPPHHQHKTAESAVSAAAEEVGSD